MVVDICLWLFRWTHESLKRFFIFKKNCMLQCHEADIDILIRALEHKVLWSERDVCKMSDYLEIFLDKA